MNTYVMSDIHGCFDKFQNMLNYINFTENDQLIIAGDYIDRGPNNYEMLNWISNSPDNVLLLCGNHDKEFAANVRLMQSVMETELINFDINSAKDNKVLYQLTKILLLDGDSDRENLFDYYETIGKLIEEYQVTFNNLAAWAVAIDEMPYHYRLQIGGRSCVVVHAGYINSLDGIMMKGKYTSLEEFYIYAREDAYIYGGVPHGMIIAGHTPTIAEKEFAYNDGYVAKYYNKKIDCIFYDIDCGCSYANVRENARLACIRLEDEKIFYI